MKLCCREPKLSSPPVEAGMKSTLPLAPAAMPSSETNSCRITFLIACSSVTRFAATPWAIATAPAGILPEVLSVEYGSAVGWCGLEQSPQRQESCGMVDGSVCFGGHGLVLPRQSGGWTAGPHTRQLPGTSGPV